MIDSIHVDDVMRTIDEVDTRYRGVVEGPVGDPVIVIVMLVPHHAHQFIDKLIDKISVRDHRDTIIAIA